MEDLKKSPTDIYNQKRADLVDSLVEVGVTCYPDVGDAVREVMRRHLVEISQLSLSVEFDTTEHHLFYDHAYGIKDGKCATVISGFVVVSRETVNNNRIVLEVEYGKFMSYPEVEALVKGLWPTIPFQTVI